MRNKIMFNNLEKKWEKMMERILEKNTKRQYEIHQEMHKPDENKILDAFYQQHFEIIVKSKVFLEYAKRLELNEIAGKRSNGDNLTAQQLIKENQINIYRSQKILEAIDKIKSEKMQFKTNK